MAGFYGSLGWGLDADRSAGDSFRIVQLTPAGSGCSIQFGAGVTSAAPGPDRQELPGPLPVGRPGYGQCVSRARRPGPERDAEITASPPMTGGGPGPDRFRAGNETVPGRHRGRPQPDCARREPRRAGRDATGTTGTPREKEKGHEYHRRGAECQRDHRQRLRSQPRRAAGAQDRDRHLCGSPANLDSRETVPSL